MFLSTNLVDITSIRLNGVLTINYSSWVVLVILVVISKYGISQSLRKSDHLRLIAQCILHGVLMAQRFYVVCYSPNSEYRTTLKFSMSTEISASFQITLQLICMKLDGILIPSLKRRLYQKRNHQMEFNQRVIPTAMLKVKMEIRKSLRRVSWPREVIWVQCWMKIRFQITEVKCFHQMRHLQETKTKRWNRWNNLRHKRNKIKESCSQEIKINLLISLNPCPRTKREL